MPKKKQFTLNLKREWQGQDSTRQKEKQCVGYRKKGRQCNREQCKGRAVLKISLGPSASAAR